MLNIQNHKIQNLDHFEKSWRELVCFDTTDLNYEYEWKSSKVNKSGFYPNTNASY